MFRPATSAADVDSTKSFNTVTYQVRCGSEKFHKYLKEMKVMVLDIFHFDDVFDADTIRRESDKLIKRIERPNRKPSTARKPIGHALVEVSKLSSENRYACTRIVCLFSTRLKRTYFLLNHPLKLYSSDCIMLSLS